MNISSRHSNLNFAHYFVICLLLQKGAKKESTPGVTPKRNHMHDKFVFFAKLVRQKSQYGEQNTCMYVDMR